MKDQKRRKGKTVFSALILTMAALSSVACGSDQKNSMPAAELAEKPEEGQRNEIREETAEDTLKRTADDVTDMSMEEEVVESGVTGEIDGFIRKGDREIALNQKVRELAEKCVSDENSMLNRTLSEEEVENILENGTEIMVRYNESSPFPEGLLLSGSKVKYIRVLIGEENQYALAVYDGGEYLFSGDYKSLFDGTYDI